MFPAGGKNPSFGLFKSYIYEWHGLMDFINEWHGGVEFLSECQELYQSSTSGKGIPMLKGRKLQHLPRAIVNALFQFQKLCLF